MRVLVDTSAWVDFFNGFASPERRAVADLLRSDHDVCTCGVIVAEVFQGLRRDKELPRLAEIFRDLTYLEPAGIDLYFRAADVFRALRRRGETIRSTIDCVIAVLADEHGCAVLARDRDMRILLDSGLLKAGRWPVQGP